MPWPDTASAASSSPARQASASSTGRPGWVVVLLELTATADAPGRPASSGRSPSSVAMAPK